MTDNVEIAAEPREMVGKTSVRLAREGKLPAVLYGASTQPTALSIDRHDFEQLTAHGNVASTLVHLKVSDDKPVNAIVKEIQHDPVRGTIQHVDFWAVKMTQRITAVVPIHFVGDSAGAKAGGVLTHNITDIHIESLPGEIPEYAEADITALEVGDSLRVSDLKVPESITITTPADEIVCSVTPPTVAPTVEEAAVPEAGEEPELIGETEEEE